MIPSFYQPPWFLRNGHSQTLYPVLRRRLPEVRYERERLELADGDFLDLDWSRAGGRNVVIVSHGLGGSSQRDYVKGMVQTFNRRGWDAVAWNYRGCSGEPNRLLRFSHSGASDDLWQVIEAVARHGYERVGLVGFSIGGNLTLKLLGELGERAPQWLVGGVAVSVPCDLKSSAEVMASRENRPYMERFLSELHHKIRAKKTRFPAAVDDADYGALKTFRDFDDRYTAPLHGFRDAEDYWAKSSSRFFLEPIRRPVLLLNAADDPFLSPECFPEAIAARHDWLHLEVPAHGGHVGFVGNGLRPDEYYSERRSWEFLGGETGGDGMVRPTLAESCGADGG